MKKIYKLLLGLGVFGVLLTAVGCGLLDMSKVAENQLKALSAGNVEDAYTLYTSKEFQAATSLDVFKQFLAQYPALSNYKEVSFPTRETTNDKGHMEGTLTTKDGATVPINYDFVSEDGGWKIQYIGLPQAGVDSTAPTGDTTATASDKIAGFAMSDTTGDQGVVALDGGKTEFTADTAEIFLSVYLKGMKKGDQVAAGLKYVANNDAIGPAVNDVTEDGDMISNFSFSKPTNGWPTGEYAVKVMLSTGEEQNYTFTVK